MRRITKAALGGIAGFALVLGGTQAATGAQEAKYSFRNALTDLLTGADGPFDDATARIAIVDRTADRTTFRIRIRGIDPSIAGNTLGSHLHTGPCVVGTGTSAGPHYNHQVAVDGKHLPGPTADPNNLAEISPEAEVWFDLVPDQEGVAEDQTTVNFVPIDGDGNMSVVIHDGPTNPDTGVAGTSRQACFPLSVTGIFPTAPPAPTE